MPVFLCPMSTEQQILQLTASVRMLEKLVKAGRADASQLLQVQQQLDSLKNPPPPTLPLVRTVIDDEPEPIPGSIVGQDEYLMLQADLSKDADRLNRQMAELSNQLHKVPPGVACPELTGPILHLKAQIETIWDKKRYLERNRCLPPEPVTTEESQRGASENSPEKFELAYRKRRLVDLRSKLNRKLLNPKAKPAKRQEWEEELVRTNLELAEIDAKLGTL